MSSMLLPAARARLGAGGLRRVVSSADRLASSAPRTAAGALPRPFGSVTCVVAQAEGRSAGAAAARAGARPFGSTSAPAGRVRPALSSVLKHARGQEAAEEAYAPLSTREAAAYIDAAAPDVVPSDSAAAQACARAVRALGRSTAEAELCRNDMHDLFAALTTAVADQGAATAALEAAAASVAALPADVRSCLEGGDGWDWAAADLSARRAFVAGVLSSMRQPSAASLRFGALTREADADSAPPAADPDAALVTDADLAAARPGSGRAFDASLGRAGLRGRRDGLSAEELEAADRAEAAATVRLDIPGVTPALTTEGFVEAADVPVGQGSAAQSRAVRSSIAYCAEWLVACGGAATLGDGAFARLWSAYVGPTIDAGRAAAELGEDVSRRGGLLGWGKDAGAVTLDGSARHAFRGAPSVPASADAGIVALLRSDVDAASLAPGPAAEWRASLERAGVAWAAALPGGASLARADVAPGTPGAAIAPPAGSAASDVDPAIAGVGKASAPDAAPAALRTLLAAAASCASGSAAVSPRYGVPDADEVALRALDEVLSRVGAGGLEAAERRSAALYGDDVFARALPALARVAATPYVSDGRYGAEPVDASAGALTMSGLLPASAASPDEVVEVVSEGRLGSARELAALLALPGGGIDAGSELATLLRRGSEGVRGASVLAGGPPAEAEARAAWAAEVLGCVEAALPPGWDDEAEELMLAEMGRVAALAAPEPAALEGITAASVRAMAAGQAL